jgi:hypothetical protein
MTAANLRATATSFWLVTRRADKTEPSIRTVVDFLVQVFAEKRGLFEEQAPRALLWDRLFALDADHAPKRLGARIHRELSIELVPDRLGRLVAKFCRGKRLDLICRGRGRTSGHDPLQRDQKNPLHPTSPVVFAKPSKADFAESFVCTTSQA